jgi:hypothetical protein
MFNKLSTKRKINCLKINKNQAQTKSRSLNHRRIVLIITVGRMMMPKTLLDVQLALLHAKVDRVNLLLHDINGLLHRRHSQLHGTHASLKCNQSLHYLSITCILLWRWQSSLRRGCHIKYCYMNMRGLWIIILTVSPRLVIRLHQRLLANGVLDLHLGFASYTDV